MTQPEADPAASRAPVDDAPRLAAVMAKELRELSHRLQKLLAVEKLAQEGKYLFAIFDDRDDQELAIEVRTPRYRLNMPGKIVCPSGTYKAQAHLRDHGVRVELYDATRDDRRFVWINAAGRQGSLCDCDPFHASNKGMRPYLRICEHIEALRGVVTQTELEKATYNYFPPEVKEKILGLNALETSLREELTPAIEAVVAMGRSRLETLVHSISAQIGIEPVNVDVIQARGDQPPVESPPEPLAIDQVEGFGIKIERFLDSIDCVKFAKGAKRVVTRAGYPVADVSAVRIDDVWYDVKSGYEARTVRRTLSYMTTTSFSVDLWDDGTYRCTCRQFLDGARPSTCRHITLFAFLGVPPRPAPVDIPLAAGGVS